MSELKVGDIVVAHPGGPWMTVKEIDGKLITCTWISEVTGKLFEKKYPQSTLVVR